MRNLSILGTGKYVPNRRVTNDDLAQFIETSDEWISSRTGIRARHITETENTIDLALEAAKLAIEDSGVKKEDIDLVVVATVTPENTFPAAANVIQAKLGLGHVMAFDLNAACSGFVYTMDVVSKMMQTGAFKNALIVGSETLTKYIDWTDRNTCVLFGDGAGAAIIGDGDGEIIDCISHSMGDTDDLLIGEGVPLKDINDQSSPQVGFIQMKGREVFKFATTHLPKAVLEICEKNNVNLEDIDAFVCHQANERIIESAAKKLGVSMEKMFVNISEYGNTSAASVPIALDDALKQGAVKKGDLVCMVAFGGGLTWSSALVRL